jgi:putative sterol carrier protein
MSVESDVQQVPDIFEHIAAEQQVAALRDRSGVFEFDITDGGGMWFIKLDHGKPQLSEKVEHPDAIVECNPADFIAMTHGEQNLMTAYLQGRVKCSGNLGLALDFRRLLPVPA